jgi:hypothetical protein
MRTVAISVILSIAAGLLAAGASGADPSASLRMVACSPWQEGRGGLVGFEAQMRALPASDRMWLRYQLFERIGGGRYESVRADGLGGWRKSRRGAISFRHDQIVKGLRQGGVYRALVDYRWYDAGGQRLRSLSRRSSPCRQPGGLPNLRVVSVESSPATVVGAALYRVVVANRGASEALNVGVVLMVDGDVVDEAEPIALLKPGQRRAVEFTGPVCRRSVRAVVDPKHLIAESLEEDNTLGGGCAEP